MEIPWGVMAWTAITTLILCISVYGVYVFSKFLFKKQNLKLEGTHKMSKKQIRIGVVFSTFISAIILTYATFMISTSLYQSYHPTIDWVAIETAQEIVRDNFISPDYLTFHSDEDAYVVRAQGGRCWVTSYVFDGILLDDQTRHLFEVVFDYDFDLKLYEVVDVKIEY